MANKKILVVDDEKQLVEILKQLNLEQLIEQAAKIQKNYEIKRTITISQLPDGTYKTTITLMIYNKNNLNLTGLTLLEQVPKTIAQKASEVKTSNETIVLQEDPVLEFVGTGKLGKEINFSI